MTRAASVLALLAVAGCVWVNPAHATVEYASRERKSCQYCHVDGSPGLVATPGSAAHPTTLNQRGIYYQSHNHTFDGYREVVVMGRKSPPIFHPGWTMDINEPIRRAAVGNVNPDGHSRLVTLVQDPDAPTDSTLVIRRWSTDHFVVEFTAPHAGEPDRLVVGRFATGVPTDVILTTAGAWFWEKGGYLHKASPDSLPLFGSVVSRDGVSRVLLAPGPQTVTAANVNITPGGALIGATGDPPASAQVDKEDIRASTQLLNDMGFGDMLSVGGLIGLWDARKFGTLFLYYVKYDQDFDIAADPKNPTSGKPVITYKNRSSYVVFRDPTNPKSEELWSTPRLPGTVYDVCLADPRSDTGIGMLVVTNQPSKGKGVALYFFTLD